MLGYEYVTFRTEGVGPVDLLQDHNVILHLTVRKVMPEVGPAGSPPPGILTPGTGGA